MVDGYSKSIYQMWAQHFCGSGPKLAWEEVRRTTIYELLDNSGWEFDTLSIFQTFNQRTSSWMWLYCLQSYLSVFNSFNCSIPIQIHRVARVGVVMTDSDDLDSNIHVRLMSQLSWTISSIDKMN